MSAAPTILVNGAARPLGDAQTLAQLLAALGVKAQRVAIERNGEIIPSTAFATTPACPGDRVEIIQFVGGG